MRMLNAKLTPSDQDKYNINKFLNRLLGLHVVTQNAVFGFFLQVIYSLFQLRKCDFLTTFPLPQVCEAVSAPRNKIALCAVCPPLHRSSVGL